jgi:Putative prokaryotic signal transducing protein
VTDLVEAARFDRPFQADLCRMFVESHGIHAVVFDALSYGYSEGAMVGIRVMVLDEDLDEVRRVLSDYKP